MAAAVAQRRRMELTDCKGVDMDEIVRRVEAAIDPADEDLFAKVLAHVEKASETPVERYVGAGKSEPYRDQDGDIVYDEHFFLQWLWGLQDGAFSLPEKIPRGLLESFDRYCGSVARRCPQCRTGYGNAHVVVTCYVCGAETERHCLWSDSPVWESEEDYAARQGGNRGQVGT
jgi:hypothetical protein